MRILIVTPLLPPEPGGPSYYAEGLRTAFKRKENVVQTLAFGSVRHLPSGIRHLVFFAQVLWACRRADLVVILDTVSVAVPAVIAARLLGICRIVRTGGDFVWEQYVERTQEKVKLSEFYTEERKLSRKERFVLWLQRRVVVPYTDVLAFSTEWQRGLWQKPYELEHTHAVVIENAYNIPLQKPERDAKSQTVLWIGRDITLKNVDTLREAFAVVQATYPEAHLELLANVPQDEAYAKLARARVLVLSSLSEVSPNLVAEALALGVPVIAPEDCGLRTVFGNVVLWTNTTSKTALADNLSHMMNVTEYEDQVALVRSYMNTRTYDDIAHEMITSFDNLS